MFPFPGQLDAQSHFGGFGEDEDGNEDEDEGPARKKSKAEVMEEVMAKSKAYKVHHLLFILSKYYHTNTNIDAKTAR